MSWGARPGDHEWEKEASTAELDSYGTRPRRGGSCDRCRRCGLYRSKNNGKRIYWRPVQGDYSQRRQVEGDSARKCDAAAKRVPSRDRGKGQTRP